jgi:hypothetical protein
MEEWRNRSLWLKHLQALEQHVGGQLSKTTENRTADIDLTEETAWSKDLEALQQHYESRFYYRTSRAEPSNMTAWSTDLLALQSRMDARMEAHNKTHHSLDVLDARVEASKNATVAHAASTAEHPQHTVLDDINALGRELCRDPRRSRQAQCAPFFAPSTNEAIAAVTAAPQQLPANLTDARAQLHAKLHQLAERHKAWEASFAISVADVGRTLCAGHHGDSNKSCAQFQLKSSDTRRDARTGDTNLGKRKSWHEMFRTKMTSVGEELCKDPARRSYAICKQLLSNSSSVTSNAKQALVQMTELHPELSWKSVMAWKSASKNGLRGSAQGESMTISDVKKLRAGRWTGRIPSVACIALVPKGKAVQAWMKYFLDNLRLQKYEGAIQLVLVYHHTDLETAQLVHELKTQGDLRVRGAAARGAEYPSAAAYRFGAWLAQDADVVARWDFDAWHHPHRLSLQVRGLAHSKRPACLLDRWTTLDDHGNKSTSSEGLRWDSSLIGESVWMRENWYPDMAAERGVIHSHAREVVKLNNSGLVVFHE